MKFASLIKKCSTVTVVDGWITASDNGAVFIEYLPAATGHTFAVNAKAFIETIQTLKPDYHIISDEEKVLLFDEVQEVLLFQQTPDLPVVYPVQGWKEGDITNDWTIINEFTTAQFPAIKFRSNFMEALTDESIVRLTHEFRLPAVNVMTYKILKNATHYLCDEKFLWIRYKTTAFIGLSVLDVHLPDTDGYFANWQTGTLIPSKIHTKLITSDHVLFKNDELRLHVDQIANATIEGIKGEGKYNYTFFKKAISKGLTWYFKTRTLNITGNKLKIILENQDT